MSTKPATSETEPKPQASTRVSRPCRWGMVTWAPMQLRSPSSRLRHLAMAVALTAALLAGCGSDPTPQTRASVPAGNHPQPPSSAGLSVSAEFKSLPKYPGSSPVGRETVTGASVVRSFEAPANAPARVLSFYQDHLSGWAQVDAPHALGAGRPADVRGRWERNQDSLTISSSPAPGLGANKVEYSLVLRRG